MDFLTEVRKAADVRILYTDHALKEMLSEDKIITVEEIRYAVYHGEIIENYPDDKRGHSCLILSVSPDDSRAIHVVCAPKDEYLAIITSYVPSLDKWNTEFRIRR